MSSSRPDKEKLGWMLDDFIATELSQDRMYSTTFRAEAIRPFNSLDADARATIVLLAIERMIVAGDECLALDGDADDDCDDDISLKDRNIRRVDEHRKLSAYGMLGATLLEMDSPLSDDEIVSIVDDVKCLIKHSEFVNQMIVPLVRFLERRHKDSPAGPVARAAAQSLAELLDTRETLEWIRLKSRTLRAVGLPAPIRLPQGGMWSDQARSDLEAMQPMERDAWCVLLDHAMSADGAAPTVKWMSSARELSQAIGEDEVCAFLSKWLTLADSPQTENRQGSNDVPLQRLVLGRLGEAILKGMCWIGAALDRKDLAPALAKAARAGFRNIPRYGRRSLLLGNAGAVSLGMMSSDDALRELFALRSGLKGRTAAMAIERALRRFAARRGVSEHELEDMGAPTFELSPEGEYEEPLGEWSCVIRIEDTDKTTMLWRRSDGREQKSCPKSVTAEHGPRVKELRAIAKQIERSLAAQKGRLEQSFIDNRVWTVSDWRLKVLAHPLVGRIARRLIWALDRPDDAPAPIWFDAATRSGAVNVEGKPVDMPDDGVIRLWHPLMGPREQTEAWRLFIEEHGIRQPFKQAHRETYTPTSAECVSDCESDRFESHLVRQHQFAQLCTARGWRFRMQLFYVYDDCDSFATRKLPMWRMTAEFEARGIWDESEGATTDGGSFMYLKTGLIRFRSTADPSSTRKAGGVLLTLEEVPPVVFSEIMRDADLFVSVAGAAVDPNWRGAFEPRPSDLSHVTASAIVRRDVLQRLLPRLRIGAQCELTDRFLNVRGERRQYRIHLGSGAALLSPDDRALVIPRTLPITPEVRGVSLPFDGDETLLTIVARAFLLADDEKITEPEFLEQIER